MTTPDQLIQNMRTTKLELVRKRLKSLQLYDQTIYRAVAKLFTPRRKKP